MDNEIIRAFKNGNYKRASELLQKVIDPNNVDLLGFYPDKCKHIYCNTYKVSLLHLAAYHGWLDICHQLITKYNHDLHVHKVCQSLIDHSKQFKQYSGSLLDISKQGQTLTVLDDVPPPPPPLFYATLGGHYEVVKYLINECNCDPHQKSVEGETPLYLACLAGHYDIVTYLINKCHSDPNTTIEQMIPVPRSSIPFSSNSTTPLYGLLSIVDHILYTPLHIACRYGHLDIVKFLVSVSSVDVNSKDSDGYTPLHTACRYDQLDIVKCLVSVSSVDVNSKASDGYTPLHIALHYSHSAIVECLLSLSSVDVNIKDDDGYTPLNYFQALVSVEPSSEVTITDGFGWCLWCPNPCQFYSTRFFHVLLLRLAYTLSLKVNGGGIIPSTLIQPFDGSCTIWKNGISWTRDGVKIVLQVSEQNRSVILLVQPNNGVKYCEIRSSVIKKTIEVKNEFCICPDTKAFLISPHQLSTVLQYNLAELSLYEVQDVARSVVLKKKYITNDRSETLDISSLLGQLEPYHSLPLSVIQQLFDDSKVSDHIPDHFLRVIQERCRPIMDIYPVTRESNTYQSVRDHLNRFSIFAGRNPFVSELGL